MGTSIALLLAAWLAAQPAPPPELPPKTAPPADTGRVEPAPLQPLRPDALHPDTLHPETLKPEVAVHVDPALARATSEMLAAYRATLAELSGESLARLADSQRLWVRYAAERCQLAQDAAARLPPPPRALRRDTLTPCLIRAVNDRQAELKGAMLTVGPWTFLRTVDHRIRPAYTERGAVGVEEQVTRLRLARPTDEAQKRWDGAVGRLLDQTIATTYDLADGDLRSSAIELRDTSLKATAEVSAASPDMIDVAVRATADTAGPNGAGPPLSTAHHLIWSVRLDRPIDPTDLFDPRTAWRPALAQMAADRVAASPPGGATPQMVQAAMAVVGDPSRWSLKPWGLALDLRPAAPGAAPDWALVPWPLLAPYLKRPAFIDPAGLIVVARS